MRTCREQKVPILKKTTGVPLYELLLYMLQGEQEAGRGPQHLTRLCHPGGARLLLRGRLDHC